MEGELPDGYLFSAGDKQQTESIILKKFNKLSSPIWLTTKRFEQ